MQNDLPKLHSHLEPMTLTPDSPCNKCEQVLNLKWFLSVQEASKGKIIELLHSFLLSTQLIRMFCVAVRRLSAGREVVN